jgi:GT2 family glycosyltransferase
VGAVTVSVLLATTGRHAVIPGYVENLAATTEGHAVELVVAVDSDVDTLRALTGMHTPGRLTVALDYSPVYRGCSRAWNDALAMSTGDPVVLAADDLEWQPGWLDAALKTLDQFEDGWGLVGFNDGHWGAELSTHYLMSRRFVIEVLGGVIAWDAYKHSFNDREANERARAAGRYAWCKDAHVHHRHWLFGGRDQDQTDTRLLGHHPESERAYQQRVAAGFPNDYEAVITC